MVFLFHTLSFLSTYKNMMNRPWRILCEIKKTMHNRIYNNSINNNNTCNELKIVNIHANATVLSFIASSPNIQVQPSMGITMTVAFSNAL